MSLELTPENMQGVFDENAGKAMLLFCLLRAGS